MNRIVSRFLLTILTVISCAIWFGSQPVALAAANTANAINLEAIVSRHNVTIPSNELVEDVVVLGHNVTVSGNVTEILVVVNGNIHLTSTARAETVVDLGGSIQRDRGAVVHNIYSASLSTPFWNGALFGTSFLLLLWLVMLAVGIGFTVLAIFLSVALRRHVDQAVEPMDRSIGRVGLVGALLSVVILGLAALSAVTLVGLPVTALLLVIYIAIGSIGIALASIWTGKQILRHSPVERPISFKTLIGAGLLLAFSSIPAVGLLFFGIVWLVGIGTFSVWLLSLWTNRPARHKAKNLKNE